MKTKKTLIVCQSIHHGNTMKIAEVLAGELNAEIKKPSEVENEGLEGYDLIGFGSGIYDDKHHVSLLNLADRLPDGAGKKAFIFSTSGAPVAILGNKFLSNYSAKAHAPLKNKLESRGYRILGDLILPGFNTNSFLKYFGGLNKNRPDHKDIERAKVFASKISEVFKNTP
ncbi:MAG: flavodoxin family protein [Candidatus Altiarchaeia archaeon]